MSDTDTYIVTLDHQPMERDILDAVAAAHTTGATRVRILAPHRAIHLPEP